MTTLPPQNGRRAIRQLKQRQVCVIKPADKGSGTVIMDKTWYIGECNRQLNYSTFYRRLNEDITVDIQKQLTIYVNRIYTDDLIDEKTKQYLIQPDVKPGSFCILPKVHKPGNPGRPIVSSNSHPILLTTIFNLLSTNYHLMLKTPMIFSINSLPLVIHY